MRNFFEVQVVPIDDLPAMARSSSSLPTARVLATWLARVLNTEPGEGALCLSCDAEFRGQPSWLAMVAAPFAGGGGKALISGICPDCAEHPDLEGVVIEWLRHGAMPDLEVVTTGSRS